MRWRVSLQDYSITVYTTGVLASKAVHLHHHYASEEFGLLDFIFSPTFFLYDIVAWSTVYLLLFGYENLKSTRLSGSLLVTDLKHNAPPLNDSSYNTLSATDAYAQTAGNVHVAPSKSAKSGSRFARFLGYCLVLITTYFSVADAFVYLNFGGLCSWPTVIEVTFSPGSVYTFMTQWVSIGEFFTIIVTPELTCAAFYVLTVIWQNFPLELLSTYQRVRAFDASIFALTLALKMSSVIPQPAAGMLLLIASISMLFKLVARLQTHVQRYVILIEDSPPSSQSCRTRWWLIVPHSDGQSNSLSPDSDTRRDSNTKSRAHDANSSRGNSIKLTIALVFAGMSLFRPPAFHDVSVTAPLSLCLAVLGFTPEQCPVGKSWPTLPHQPTPYFLGCESNGCSQSQIDLAFASSDIAGYLPTTQSIEGFEMISPERTSQWKNWTRARSGVAPQGYNSMFDLSKVSNHNAALLQELSVPGSADRVGLRQLKVNHIIFFVMESTSWEMFPLRRRGRIYEKIMKSRIPGKHYASMDNLAPTARRLFTGETSNNTSGISDGGIVVEGAQTAISYTLKSLIASHCGVSPLAMDFTREAAGDAHLYQPCLAHVLKALNHIGSSGENSAYGETTKEMWKVLYSQSTHARFDRQISLMHKMGFDKAGEMLNKHEMDDPEAPYPVPQSEKDLPTGFFFYPEEYLTPYFRDFWTNGRDHQQRTFVSHLTTTTHCPWELPETWSFQEYGEDEKLNRMLNAFEYQDQWLKQLLDMLIELGIYNETLVVLSGDQYVSIPFVHTFLHHKAFWC